MELLFKRNGQAGRWLFILLIIIFTFMAVTSAFILLNGLIYILPIAAAWWMIHKAIKLVSGHSSKVKAGNYEDSKISEITVTDSMKHFEDAIANNKVIDVDYTEV